MGFNSAFKGLKNKQGARGLVMFASGYWQMRGSYVSCQEHLGFYSIKCEGILDLLRA
jgi:hypothetical protein